MRPTLRSAAQFKLIRLAALVAPALAASLLAPAITQAAPSFKQCKRQGHKAFRCATLRVPLARTSKGDSKRKIGLHVELAKGKRRGVLLALAGGPGQAATDFAPQLQQELGPALRRYQLLTLDQRGTGRSGALRCPNLDVDQSPAGVRKCARKIGARRRFYTTRDSALDIEALRHALGAKRLFIYGVSYGTFVATQYGRRFPRRVERLLLDSNMAPTGWDALMRPSFTSAPRVLRELCSGPCRTGIAKNIVGANRRLVSRMKNKPLSGTAFTSTGQAHQEELEDQALFNILFQGDFFPLLRSLYPGAVVAALQGDGAPFLRIAAINAGDENEPPEPVSADGDLSGALNITTNCGDTRLPFGSTRSVKKRIAALRRLGRSYKASSFDPFTPGIAVENGLGASCLGWPDTSVPGAISRRRLPDVPALLVNGAADLRTPLSSARRTLSQLPRGELVSVANTGHSVVAHPCVRVAMKRWIKGRRAGSPCRSAESAPVLPLPPTSLSQLNPATNVPGDAGRTVAAALATITDTEAIASGLEFSSKPLRAGGLRGGSFSAEISEVGLMLNLRGLVYVPGVVATGTIMMTNAGCSGSLEIGGALSGSLAFGLDDRVTGQVGGTAVEYRGDGSACT